MLIIGELINGMYASVGKAIKNKDKTCIQELAIAQQNAGASALDVNCGPVSRNQVEDIKWLIETIQEVTKLPLSIDSSNVEVIESGLKVNRNAAIINSTTADQEKLDKLIPLAIKHKAKLIGLTISSKGIPQNKDQRLELAASIVSACIEAGFPVSDLYIDPIVLPVNVAQNQLIDILESIKEFKIISSPAPNTIIGLSNVSQGTKERKLINRVFLNLAIGSNLDAAILDPLDNELMQTLITAELILNKHIYCDSFLTAYKEKS